MVAGIFGILYLILIFIYVIAAFFIVYHIIRFSFNHSIAVVTLGIFLSVFLFVFFSNLVLFLTINWEKVFSFS